MKMEQNDFFPNKFSQLYIILKKRYVEELDEHLVCHLEKKEINFSIKSQTSTLTFGSSCFILFCLKKVNGEFSVGEIPK
jgi:hypothetical protein